MDTVLNAKTNKKKNIKDKNNGNSMDFKKILFKQDLINLLLSLHIRFISMCNNSL